MSPLLISGLVACCAFIAMATTSLPTRSWRPIPNLARTDDDIAVHATRHSAADLVHRLIERVRTRARRRRGIDPAAVANWCDDLARRTRSGETLRDALAGAVPAHALLAIITAPLRHGLQRGATLRGAADERSAALRTLSVRGASHAALATDVIAVMAEIGGSSAAPLDRVAAALRLRAADQQERVAHSSQAQLSAHALTVVPIAMLTISFALDSGVRHVVGQPVGALCVTGGLVVNVTGWIWMRHTIGGHP